MAMSAKLAVKKEVIKSLSFIASILPNMLSLSNSFYYKIKYPLTHKELLPRRKVYVLASEGRVFRVCGVFFNKTKYPLTNLIGYVYDDIIKQIFIEGPDYKLNLTNTMRQHHETNLPYGLWSG